VWQDYGRLELESLDHTLLRDDDQVSDSTDLCPRIGQTVAHITALSPAAMDFRGSLTVDLASEANLFEIRAGLDFGSHDILLSADNGLLSSLGIPCSDSQAHRRLVCALESKCHSRVANGIFLGQTTTKEVEARL
jgi:hypothetical protein